jgi:hypothetical protein
MGRSFAEHGLRCVLPQGTGAAVCGLRAQSRKPFGLDGRGTCHRWFLLRCREGRGAGASRSIIVCVMRPAFAINGSINEASGRFRQYFFGISVCMALIFSRAGLKMLA